jgi:predicted dehydrogenase
MNFAVIGVGSFGIKRAQSIKNSKLAKLIAINDVNKDNVQKAETILNVKALNLDQILNDKSIDVVCICAPNKFHKDIIIKSLKADKHVFCEKPISRNLQEAKEIYEVAKTSKTILQVGSNHRFFESVLYAKKLVDEGVIGEVLSFNGRIGHNGERLKDSWFWKKDISGGGTLLDNGCHLLDLSRYFVGDFISGKGITTNTYWKNIEVEDTASGVFNTQDGKTASIFCSWRLLSGYFFFELNGSDGYINVDGRFDTHGGDKIFWSTKKDGKLYNKDFSHLKPNSYQLEIDNFINNLNSNKDCSPNAKDAYEVMKMIDFIYNK